MRYNAIEKMMLAGLMRSNKSGRSVTILLLLQGEILG